MTLDHWTRCFRLPRLVNRVAAFAREFRADRIWCILEGQTLIRLGGRVARRLNVPLHTQVYDPPQWWIREQRFDSLSAGSILRAYDSAIRASRRCAAASWAMAEDYRRIYGVQALPLIPSLDSRLAVPPAEGPTREKSLTIGVAGKMYAADEWRALLAALDRASWTMNGRKVTVRYLGPSQLQTSPRHASGIESLGWRSQPETIRLLSETDVLYCPYWFDSAFEPVARHSFPAKLTTYLAAGRPVLFHGPEYAAPAKFLREHDAGLGCHSLEPDDILGKLQTLIADPEVYRRLSRNGSQAFHERLTLSSYRRAFSEFLEVDEASLLSGEDQLAVGPSVGEG